MSQTPTEQVLVRVTAPHFCAGVLVDQSGKIVVAAPILKWIIGKRIEKLVSWCMKNGYGIEEIE